MLICDAFAAFSHSLNHSYTHWLNLGGFIFFKKNFSYDDDERTNERTSERTNIYFI